MKTRRFSTFLIAGLGLALAALNAVAQQGSSPLKVFILAGQSNMEGQGEMNPVETQGTLEYLVANNPATYGHLKDGADWVTRDDVWISYRRGGTTLLNGDLSAGYGVSATTIGPELQFGVELGNYLGEQILLIKTAWGGKSLFQDFRPPSSGWSVNPPVAPGDQGYYYQQMLLDLNDVLNNLAAYHPGYNAAGGYELAGFGWHQGWNDRVNADAVVEYEVNMRNFINDVRAALGVPKLPFVIATTGMSGLNESSTSALALMDAQLAMEDFTKYPDFDGNVAVVDTREFWRGPSESPTITQGFHWHRNAETYFLIGQSMATHMRVLLDGGDTLPPSPNPMTWAVPPTAAGEGEITMTADTATDIIGVQYFFESLTPGGNDSGWQDSPTYTDTGLANSTSYSYRAKARDESPDLNETDWAPTLSATTTPADLTPPSPNPLTWAQVPTALSSRAIIMSVNPASDPSGVEYYFANTTVSGHDSGWQDSPEYTDVDLDPSVTYTYEVRARDKSVASTETTPSAPASATTLDAPPPGPVIYEPFDDPDAGLSGNNPGIGLTGSWNSSGATVTTGSLSYSDLATSGNRVTRTGSTGFQNSGVSLDSTLNDYALLADSSRLWFSVVAVSVSSGRTYFTLGTGNTDGFDRIGGTSGSGLGVRIENGNVHAHGWSGGAIKPTGASVPDGPVLVVGRITWGTPGNNDVLEVFVPGADLALPATPVSTLSFDFDQSAFNTISFAGGTNGVPELDEIRFGATYADVVPVEADVTPPTPNPLTWASVPTAVGEDQITMTATTASDPNGVEYYFEETTGNPGGSDSGWQDSPTYSNTGLSPETTYSYQVKARDKSSGANETAYSSLESATTLATDIIAPTPNPMTWSAVPTASSSSAISMTASTASDPSQVEYYFEETSGNPGGSDSGWQDSPEYTDTGLSPSTIYSYQVKARDKSPAANETSFSPLAFATTQSVATTALIYEPFADSQTTLAGNTPGTGLSGTWSADGGLVVEAGSMAWGNLATSGDRIANSSGNNQDGGVSIGATLSDAGLLNNEAVLWFSALGTSVSGSGNRSYLTLGTGRPDGFDRIGGNGGYGVGIRLDNGSAYAHGWRNRSAIKPGGTSVADGTVFIVGKITWAANGSNDILELFLPGTDLALPATPVSTMVGDFDQSTFTTLGLAVATSPNDAFDEIRFGASYVSVVPSNADDTDDYSLWSAGFLPIDIGAADADFDGDGLSNDEERIWGLDPTTGSSVNPITTGLDATAGTLTYTRRKASLLGLTFSYQWSTTLDELGWTTFTPISESSDSGDPVETVTITLDAALLSNPNLFVRVVAE